MYFNVGNKLYHYPYIDSTNDEAKRAIDMGIQLPALFVSDIQTAGRGRRGKCFYSAEGGVYMTLAIPYSERFKNPASITTLAASAVALALESYGSHEVDIKWVNDIYYDGRKVAGILCETVIDKDSLEPKAIIIGIGLNLNVTEFPEDLKDIAGPVIMPKVSAMAMALRINIKLFELLYRGVEYMTFYKCRSSVLNQYIEFEHSGETVEAYVEDIDSQDGTLIIRLNDGSLRQLSSGTIRLSSGYKQHTSLE